MEIPFPYDEMLKELKNIPGFDDFLKFISERGETRDWIVEIKGLYELHQEKVLEKIFERQVTGSSTPEGLFKIGSAEGILECAAINCLIDANNETKSGLNKIMSDLKKKKSGSHQYYIDKQGKHFQLFRKENGIITVGENPDIDKKIQRVYKDKRDQHRKMYGDYYKIYYFFLNCSPGSFNGVETSKINLHDREMLVINWTWFSKQGGVERKIIIRKNFPYNLNLINKYFNSSTEVINL